MNMVDIYKNCLISRLRWLAIMLRIHQKDLIWRRETSTTLSTPHHTRNRSSIPAGIRIWKWNRDFILICLRSTREKRENSHKNHWIVKRKRLCSTRRSYRLFRREWVPPVEAKAASLTWKVIVSRQLCFPRRPSETKCWPLKEGCRLHSATVIKWRHRLQLYGTRGRRDNLSLMMEFN